MKQITLLLLLCTTTGLLPAQNAIIKTFDFSPSYDAGHKVLPDGAGYVIFGNRRQNAMDPQRDLFLLRVNAAGEQTAYFTYGNATSSEGSPEGMGLCATTNGWVLASDRKESTPGTPSKAWVLKVNTSGAVVWSVLVSFPGLNSITMADVKPVPGGGFIASGYGFSGGNRTMVALRVSEDGVVEWSQKYSLGSGIALFVSPGGNTCFVAGGNKIWKIRTNTGTQVWERSLVLPAYGPASGAVSIDLQGITATSTGNFAVAGQISNDDLLEYNSAFYVAHWTETGEALWTRISHSAPITGFGFNEASSIQYLTNSRELLVGGTADGHLLITRFNLSGQELKNVTLAAAGEFFSPNVIKSGGNYIATAGVLTDGVNVNTFFYRSAGNALELNSQSSNDNNTQARRRASATLYPNPVAGSQVTLDFECHTPDTQWVFRLVDAQGRWVRDISSPVFEGPNQLYIDVADLSAGLYWLEAPAAAWAPLLLVKR